MKTTRNHNQRSGFTLIEMVGVLAVIAVLAALLVPKIFAAIEESRYTNAIGSINGVKAATMNYFSKNGGFTAADGFDTVLITDGQLEGPFKTRIGTAWACDVKTAATCGVADGNRFSKLDGAALAASGNVVQVKITAVKANEAWELSKRLDGDAMSAADATVVDDEGRVTYAIPAAGVTDVVVYIAHK